MRPFVLAFLGSIGVAGALSGAGLIVVHDEHYRPLPWFAIVPPPPERPPHPPHWRRPHWAALSVVSHRVDAKVEGQAATTTVTQEFYNPNARPAEGTFFFPLPKGAHIERFAMEMDGRPVEAELLTAEKAREIYETIVRNMKDPALLEYAGRDVYKVRIFPIESRGTRRITVTYSELLKAADGVAHFIYPLTAERFSESPPRAFEMKLNLSASRPLQSIYSPSHAVRIERTGDRSATVTLERPGAASDGDFHLYYSEEEGEFGLRLLTHRTGEEEGYFVMLATPGSELRETAVMPKDVAFVLDTSGSMAGGKLEQAKKALAFCVENLNEGDRFEVIRFSTEAEGLFGGLKDADAAHRAKAGAFIKELKPIGGTAIHDALSRAAQLRPVGSDRPYVVIFLTDGRPTLGETDEGRIVSAVVREKDELTRVFCFGIGTDVNTHLLDRITEATKAFSQYVLAEEDLEVKVSGFFTKIKEPVMANPRLMFPDGVRVSGVYPSPLPDLFKGEQLVVTGRFKGEGRGRIVLEGNVGSRTQRHEYAAEFPRGCDRHEFIPRLWATRRVGYLLDEMRLRGENAELKDEAIQLARRYGIVTPYTAYLIVEEERARGVAADRLLLREDFYRPRAREELSGVYRRMAEDRSGDAAVSGARFTTQLKQASSATVAFSLGNAGAAPVPGAFAPAGGASWAGEPMSQSRHVGGRTFYAKGEGWMDAAVAGMGEVQPKRVRFGSEEYFELERRHPEIRPWLALGTHLQFELNKTVYEIFD